MANNPYTEDYFLRGREVGVSLYENYRWLPQMTRPMVASMVSALGIKHSHRILDFGCSRGYIVRALREMEYNAFGADISEWALANADDNAAPFVGSVEFMLTNSNDKYDWIVAKDVLEHIADVQTTIDMLMSAATVGVFAVVPLSLFDAQPYIVADYELDLTHVQRLCLGTWAGMFMRPGWSVEGRYCLPWIKQAYYKDGWERGNGFIVAKRLEN